EESATPTKESRIGDETGGLRLFLEKTFAEIAIEVGQIVGEVRFENIDEAVSIVVGGRHTHAGLIAAVTACRDTRLKTAFGECSVAVVPEKIAHFDVIGDVNVRTAVIIEIRHENAQTVARRGFPNPAVLCYIRESAIAIVAKKEVLGVRQPLWAAVHGNPLIDARTAARKRRFLRVEVDIVADKQVQPAIAIVIEKSAAGAPLGLLIQEARLRGDVGECAAVVVIQDVPAPVGDEQVVMAIVIEITDTNALPPAGALQARFSGDIRKRAIAIVLEQAIGRVRGTVESCAVDQKQV